MACGVPWRSRRAGHSRSSWQSRPPRGASGSARQTGPCPVSPARRCPGALGSAQGYLPRVAQKPGGQSGQMDAPQGRWGQGTGQPPHGIQQPGDGSCFLWVSSHPGLSQLPSLLPGADAVSLLDPPQRSLHTHDTYRGLLQGMWALGLEIMRTRGPSGHLCLRAPSWAPGLHWERPALPRVLFFLKDTHAHTHSHTHTCVYTHTWAHTAQVHTNADKCEYMCTHACTRAHTQCTHVHKYARMQRGHTDSCTWSRLALTRVHTHSQVGTHVHSHVGAHTHGGFSCFPCSERHGL